MVCHQVQESLQKITKPPLAMLRMQVYSVAKYINDKALNNQIFDKSLLTVVETIHLFQKLGFIIHPGKNKFILAKIRLVSSLTQKKW